MGRQIRIACLGEGRDWVVRLACLCIEAARGDDAFEFMIDARGDAVVAHETAVCVEMLWNDLPNVALAHLSDQRHALLLGAQLVVDFSACTAARKDTGTSAEAGEKGAASKTDEAGDDTPGGPSPAPLVIDDWEHPVPHRSGCAPGSVPLTAEEARGQLALDMSLLCPSAVVVAPPAEAARFDEVVGAALSQALERAAPT